MCHIPYVTLFNLTLRPGQSIFDQVLFAAIKSFVSGAFQPGQAFPSVRVLAADLKIHPNTAHKVIQHLIHEGWLEAHPGIGTVVAAPPAARDSDKTALLSEELEQIVVAAMRLGVTRDAMKAAMDDLWNRLAEEPGEKQP
jgi:GntR family transcriptional regulator